MAAFVSWRAAPQRGQKAKSGASGRLHDSHLASPLSQASHEAASWASSVPHPPHRIILSLSKESPGAKGPHRGSIAAPCTALSIAFLQLAMRVLAGFGQAMRANRSSSCGVWSPVRTASLKVARAASSSRAES